MTDSKISALTATTSLASTDMVPLATAGAATKKITGSSLKSETDSRDHYAQIARGVISETLPLGACNTTSNLVTQQVYYALLGLRIDDVVTGLAFAQQIAATSSTYARVGLYNSSGTLLASSASAITTFETGTGKKQVAFSSPYQVTANGGYYASVLWVGSGTAPQFLRGYNTTASLYEALSGGVRGVAIQTGQSALPSTATFATANNPGFPFWMAAY